MRLKRTADQFFRTPKRPLPIWIIGVLLWLSIPLRMYDILIASYHRSAADIDGPLGVPLIGSVLVGWGCFPVVLVVLREILRPYPGAVPLLNWDPRYHWESFSSSVHFGVLIALQALLLKVHSDLALWHWIATDVAWIGFWLTLRAVSIGKRSCASAGATGAENSSPLPTP